MKIKFSGEVLNCKQIETYPSRARIGDLLVGPAGRLFKVLTVQPGCPVWESNTKTFCAVLVESETHETIPLRDFAGKVSLLRPRKR